MERATKTVSAYRGREIRAFLPSTQSAALSRRFGLPALTALGGFVMLYKLGASSYFIDEANSIAEVRGSTAHLWEGVRSIEASPATYFFALHYWLQATDTTVEWVARLPS